MSDQTKPSPDAAEPTSAEEQAAPDLVASAQRLKALTHPIRVRLLWRLIMSGPSRTSDLASHVAEPPNKVSYHLSALEAEGFIVRVDPPTDATDGRERWWAAKSKAGVSVDLSNPELAEGLVEFQAVEEGLLHEFKEQGRTFNPKGELPHHSANFEVPLSWDEARQVMAFVDDLASKRGRAEDVDAMYFFSYTFFPFRTVDGDQP